MSPDKIVNFSLSHIDSLHRDQAPFIRSILRACTSDTIEIFPGTPADSKETPNICDEMASYQGNLDSFRLLCDRQNSRRNRSLVAVVTLCLLSYARSEQSNVFQTIVGYAAFAHNIPKRAIKTFYQMGLTVSYESIRRTLAANANAVEREMKEKVLTRRFFISYDNINFYEHVRDARIFNQGAQINYTTGYICFLGLSEQYENGHPSDCTWQNQYLSSSLIDRTAVNALHADDFHLSSADIRHKGKAVRYMVSGVLGRYFAKAMRKQKVEIDGILFMSSLLIYIC